MNFLSGKSSAKLSNSSHAQMQGNPTADDVQQKPLVELIKAWWGSKGSKRADVPLQSGQALHRKFAAHPETFTYSYNTVDEFFAGLEGLIGPPSADVFKAMECEHASTTPFIAGNDKIDRTTTPRAEWIYVAEKAVGEPITDDDVQPQDQGKVPSHKKDAAATNDFGELYRQNWKLKDFAEQPSIKEAGLMLEEVAGIRLYTGAMYKPYNTTLRYRTRGVFVTTLHSINSGIVKLSKKTKATTVYRGVAGGALPEDFWTANDDGVMGGVEMAFMSTSTDRDVALDYMKMQDKKFNRILFEIRMGMVDRGADVSKLSQYPGEKEILFAPLTGLEVAAVPRDELGVLIIELRLSCNLQDQTIEQVVGKMKTSHIALLDSMMDDLRHGVDGLPLSVLKPLEDKKDHCKKLDHEYFMKPQQYLKATKDALDATDACYANLADKESWNTTEVSDAVVAQRMRQAAAKCNKDGRSKEAAALLMMAVERAGVPAEYCQEVELRLRSLQLASTLEADAGCALKAAGLLLATNTSDPQWVSTLEPTLRGLGVLAGDRHTVGRLALLYGYGHIRPADEYDDLSLHAYKTQPFFHQINTKSPSLQLVQDEPYVFLHPGFLTPDECREAMALFALSSKKGSSATSEAQTKVRTSSTVVYGVGTELPLLRDLRERIAALARVEVTQLQATKITCYEKGQFFGKHSDCMVGPSKTRWLDRLLADTETAEQLTAQRKACFMPERFCTVWIYLNDVEKGGITRFHSSTPEDHLYNAILPKLGEVFQKKIPGLPKSRSKSKDLVIKPKAGTAVIHFPCTTQEYYGMPDFLATHEGEPAVDPKYILQQFIYWEPLETDFENFRAMIRSPTAPNPSGLGVEEREQVVYQEMFGTPMPSSSADAPVEAM